MRSNEHQTIGACIVKQIPNTAGGWMDFVSRVKELIDYPLNADLYSIMMREYYILGRSPQDFVNREK